MNVMETAMSGVDEIYRRCLDGPLQGGLTAQNVSLYHTSPFTIYCETFVSSEEKDPMSPYRELLLERGREHERRVIETAFPSCRRLHYETPEEGFRRLLDEMASGAEVISGLPCFISRKICGGFQTSSRREMIIHPFLEIITIL